MPINTNWVRKLAPLLRRPEYLSGNESPHRFLIEVSGFRLDRIYQKIQSNNGKIIGELHLVPSLIVELPCGCLKEMANFHLVRKVWDDTIVKACLDVAVPAVGADQLHQAGFTGDGVVVAVIDTGIYPHQDLLLPENRIIAWNDLVSNQDRPYDDNGHGTHVAGIIAGNGSKSQGRFKGLAPQAKLVGVKVLDDQGSGSISTVISGIEWCLAHPELGIKVLNLSLGALAQESYRTDPLCRATSAAWHKGIFVCSAAGNEGPAAGTINSPGINPVIMTVGNVNDQETIPADDDRLSDSSSRGPTIDSIAKPDLLAPGTSITSLWNNGNYKSLTGTSMATPVVAGAAAQLLQKWPTLTPAQLKGLLINNARSLGLGPNLQGAGVLDISKIKYGKTQSRHPLFNLLQNETLRELVMYQLMKMALERVGKEAVLFKEKRDKLIINSVSGLLQSKLKSSKL